MARRTVNPKASNPCLASSSPLPCKGSGEDYEICVRLDRSTLALLIRCDETPRLDRHFKGAGNSFRRLLSFFRDLFPARRSPTSRLEQHRSRRLDDSKIGLVQSFRPRVSCRRRFHNPKRLDADAIDHATRRIRSRGRRMGRVVLRAVSAALSDVLGRAFGLSSLAIRCAPGTSGRSHHPEPARPALHRYSDEFHVPQRSMVVLLHADPVLPDFSAAFPDGAPRGSMVVFVHCVRRRIFRALHVACRLAANGLWVLGGFAICRLPEFALGMSLAMWHTRSPAHVEWFLLRGAGLILGLILYPAALQLYHGLYEYIFVDFATGACCMLEIVGIAGIISLFKGSANLFGLVGLYSYGLYLIHQPYVIWLGLRIREMPIWAFLLICVPTLAALSAWGMFLEKGTNILVKKLVSLRKPAHE